jgi:hypothetical protein
MFKRIASLRNRRYVLAGVVILVIIGLVFIINRGGRPEVPLTIPQLYQKELTSLSSDLKELSAYINAKHEINEDIDQYISGVNNLKNPCRQINIYDKRYQNEALSNQIKDAMSNSRQLCTDFLGVLDYSQAVFQSTQAYLTINTQNWPYASSAEFTAHLTDVGKIISGTLDGLNSIKNTVNDPALAELKSQVELAESKLNQAQKAKADNNTAAADIYANELMELIEKDKTDFINARSYFWRNTVQIDALQKSVEALIKSFETK